jgi:4-amino-4-deoxy-L-arabinose transferase-like glycosyltransferase
MMAALACVLEWWRCRESPGDYTLYCGFGCLGLAILTKSNAWVLLPFLLAMVFIKTPRDWKAWSSRMGGAMVILAAICGWYFLIRYSMESQGGVVGNLARVADFYAL